MLIALERLGISCLVRMPYAVVLLISSGVASCGWPISSKHMRSGIASLALTNAAAISLSLAADITWRKMLASTWIGALCMMVWLASGNSSLILLPRKWYPPTLLRLLDADKCDESDATCRIISDLRKVIDGFG